MNTSHEALLEEPFELSCLHADDAAIARAVRKITAQTCGREKVVVIVADGEVTLTGEVSERWMQLEIEHAALHVRGVRSVVSRMRARDHHAHH
jgi:osmotically-inducible protein OsmY